MQMLEFLRNEKPFSPINRFLNSNSKNWINFVNFFDERNEMLSKLLKWISLEVMLKNKSNESQKFFLSVN